ncbi:acyl-CoA dehydratase activase [Anaeromyxobacter oryzae]|uniref:2-hydroxyglutaryl-CoA dehydratase n=1 Tax=Anaeromyxobacter oryzae TaxID=2918170 RepID=A0ABM7WZV9_9BACT|nr:acyl-CoA dehydratase activase [Anaeromyxobacter oryzae]BDG05079.1 2-hydroxyglutaryl-CoA dehydratase [Anaeromyxobacter oryzae]
MATTSVQRAFGLCVGASTVTAVELRRDREDEAPRVAGVVRRNHQGNPKDVLVDVMAGLATGDAPVLITGRSLRTSVELPSIAEPEATEYALRQVARGERYDTLVSAGGETFMVYALDTEQRIAAVHTGNKCASGTGEFFLQQTRRMDLSLERAVELGLKGRPYAVSGRCSVFCKSDCTHALNKGEPIENVTAGLCEMIASKVADLCARIPHRKVMLVGGTALNAAVVRHLEARLGGRVHVPPEAAWFEALGAALAAFERGSPVAPGRPLVRAGHSSFDFLPPLRGAESLVRFESLEYATAAPGDRCVVGLDVGSTTTKAVLLRVGDDRFLGSIYLRTSGDPVEASRACFRALLQRLAGTRVEVIGIGVTGSGRHIAGLYALTEGVVNEIVAHAAAAAFFDPEVDTIFEIGGQDAKYTHLTHGVASDYAMNEACSAGTGSFLEESAFESFHLHADEIAPLALAARRPPNFNDQCAAFISSDVKNAVHEGISREDVLAGLVYSICLNYMNRVKGHRPVGEKIFMQGGVCYNAAVPLAMAAVLGKPIVVPPEPGLMGAFGVALEVKKRIGLGLLEARRFDLAAIAARQVVHEEPFTCPGGRERCDLKCRISRVVVEGKTYPFGGACAKYYDLHRGHGAVDAERQDLVKVRTRLLFEKYATTAPAGAGPTVGINRALLTHGVFPLYHRFFTALGCRVVVPDRMNEAALTRQTTSLCYPSQLAIGFFDRLTEQAPDWYFLPQVRELWVPGGDDRQDFCATCLFSQGEPYWLPAAFEDKAVRGRVLAPTLNFREGYASQVRAFVDLGHRLGFSRRAAEAAFGSAVEVQHAFEQECREIGRAALERLRATPGAFACVLFGRPHNALTDDANKGIPRKLASRDVLVIPYDMLDARGEELPDPFRASMHWEIGQKLLRTARLVARDEQLYAVYATSFLCAFDSFLVPHVRRLLGPKPSLTLELDAHTADAGINTRIDAFLDVVRNHRQLRRTPPVSGDFRPSRLEADGDQQVFVDSAGRRTPFKDPSVKVLLPSMGDLSTRALAAAMQRVGVHAVALPPGDEEVRRLGRSVLTGKECIPLIAILGSFLRYLEHHRRPGEKLAIFMPRAHGYCRLGQYFVTTELLIRERRIPDAVPFYFAGEVGYAGMGSEFSLVAWKAIVVSDVLDDVRNALLALAVDVPGALAVLEKEFARVVEIIAGRSDVDLYRQLEATSARLAAIPLRLPLADAPQVVITGEIFVRRDGWSNGGLARILAEKGFVARSASIHEWLFYNNHLIKKGVWKPRYRLKDWFEFYVSDAVQLVTERKIKDILGRSGLYDPERIDVSEYDRYSEHLISHRLTGEPGLSTGKILKDGLDKVAGFVNIGPFGCMVTRFTEAVASNHLRQEDRARAYAQAGVPYEGGRFGPDDRIPFLTIEVDGNPYPQLLVAKLESFCLQARRIAERQGKTVLERGHLAGPRRCDGGAVRG